jgi:hypothetical protein
MRAKSTIGKTLLLRRSFLGGGCTAVLTVALGACGGGGQNDSDSSARFDPSGTLHLGGIAYARLPILAAYMEGRVLVSIQHGRQVEATKFFAAHAFTASPASHNEGTYWVEVAPHTEDQWRRALADQPFVARAELYSGGLLYTAAGAEAVNSYPGSPRVLVFNNVRYESRPLIAGLVPGEIIVDFKDARQGLAQLPIDAPVNEIANASYRVKLARGFEQAWIDLLKASPFVARARGHASHIDLNGVLHLGSASYLRQSVQRVYMEGRILVSVLEGRQPEAAHFFSIHALTANPASHKDGAYWVEVPKRAEDQWRRALADQSFTAAAELFGGGLLYTAAGAEAVNSDPRLPRVLVSGDARFESRPIVKGQVPGEVLIDFKDASQGLALLSEGVKLRQSLVSPNSYRANVALGFEEAWIDLLNSSPFVELAMANVYGELS